MHHVDKVFVVEATAERSSSIVLTTKEQGKRVVLTGECGKDNIYRSYEGDGTVSTVFSTLGMLGYRFKPLPSTQRQWGSLWPCRVWQCTPRSSE